MKGTKEQKGITLVALIITIVVLLILAVVAISSIQDGGILSYANNAASSYNQAQVNEQITINGYTDWLKYQSCSGHTYDSEDGPCTNCGYICEGHTWGTPIIIAADCSTGTNGSEEKVCSVCGGKLTKITEYYKHTLDGEKYNPDLLCEQCQKKCNHEFYFSDWYYNYNSQHAKTQLCKNCDYVMQDYTTEGCHFQNGKCTVCGGDCEHYGTGQSWTYVDASSHKVQQVCVCGWKDEGYTEEHTFTDGTVKKIDDTKHGFTRTCNACEGKIIVEETHEWSAQGAFESVGKDGHKQVMRCNGCEAQKLGENLIQHIIIDGYCIDCYWVPTE